MKVAGNGRTWADSCGRWALCRRWGAPCRGPNCPSAGGEAGWKGWGHTHRVLLIKNTDSYIWMWNFKKRLCILDDVRKEVFLGRSSIFDVLTHSFTWYSHNTHALTYDLSIWQHSSQVQKSLEISSIPSKFLPEQQNCTAESSVLIGSLLPHLTPHFFLNFVRYFLFNMSISTDIYVPFPDAKRFLNVPFRIIFYLFVLLSSFFVKLTLFVWNSTHNKLEYWRSYSLASLFIHVFFVGRTWASMEWAPQSGRDGLPLFFDVPRAIDGCPTDWRLAGIAFYVPVYFIIAMPAGLWEFSHLSTTPKHGMEPDPPYGVRWLFQIGSPTPCQECFTNWVFP